MPTINQLARQRRLSFREFKRRLKTVDTELEIAERFLSQVIKRTNKIPEQDDYQRVLSSVKTMDKALEEMAKSVIEITRKDLL